jgi:hypothetical protein
MICESMAQMGTDGFAWPYQRFGSGDAEEWMLLTRQMAFEPLPASDLVTISIEATAVTPPTNPHL